MLFPRRPGSRGHRQQARSEVEFATEGHTGLHCYAALQSQLTACRPCKGPQGMGAAPADPNKARSLTHPPSQWRRATRKTAEARPHAHTTRRTQGPGLDGTRSRKRQHRTGTPRPNKPPGPPPGQKHKYGASQNSESAARRPRASTQRPSPARPPCPRAQAHTHGTHPAEHPPSRARHPPCTTYPAPSTPHRRAHRPQRAHKQATPFRLAAHHLANREVAQQNAGTSLGGHRGRSPGCPSPSRSPTNSSCNTPAARTPNEPPPLGAGQKGNHAPRSVTTAQGNARTDAKPTATRPRDRQGSRLATDTGIAAGLASQYLGKASTLFFSWQYSQSEAQRHPHARCHAHDSPTPSRARTLAR